MSYVAGVNWKAPSIFVFVLAWLRSRPGVDPNGVGMDRPAGGVLPYRQISRPVGSDDKITATSLVSINTFDTDMDTAEASADVTHNWMISLGPPLAPQQPVTLPGGLVVFADCVETKLLPQWIPYGDDATMRRFVARYEIALRFTATS